jgi:hypothetical protein
MVGVRKCPKSMNPFHALEIAAVSLFAFLLVLFIMRPDVYSTGLAVFMLVLVAANVWVLDRARRRW